MFQRIVQRISTLFTTPDIPTLAKAELAVARRELFEAEASRDYYTAMVSYHKARIANLVASAQASVTQYPRFTDGAGS